jgi:hypothetical protein
MNDRDNLLRMLHECLRWVDEHEDEEERFNARAFEDMLSNLNHGWPLSNKQQSWIRGVHEKLFDEPKYENLWSSGKVSRGGYGATPTPEVLKNLPKRPPGRA